MNALILFGKNTTTSITTQLQEDKNNYTLRHTRQIFCQKEKGEFFGKVRDKKHMARKKEFTTTLVKHATIV